MSKDVEFAWVQTSDRFKPKLNRSDDYEETAEHYCRRMRSILPNFPDEILSQWFYRHWSGTDDYAWLGYDRLRFKNQQWSSHDIMSSGIQISEAIQIDHSHHENGIGADREVSIQRYFDTCRTWPVPPVFLANPHGNIVRPDGFRLTHPYHVLDGNHRAAIFWSYYDSGALANDHLVWIAHLTM